MSVASAITTDTLAGWLSTREAAPLLCNCRPQTVRNHMTRGTVTKDGRVRLRGVILGGQYYTKAEWISEYLELVRRATLPDPVEGPVVPRETAEEQAERFREAKQRATDVLTRRRPAR